MNTRHASHASFAETHWSMVLSARDWRSPKAQDALARLCQSYWYPLYAFIRRRGHSPHDAQDLTQGFFTHLFEHDTLHRVEQEKGRFRTFLLAALTRFLNNERDKRHTRKRGGAHKFISWDALEAEERYRSEPGTSASPDGIFDQQWAASIVEQAQVRLRAEYVASGKGAVFAALQELLAGQTMAGAYAELSTRLQMSEPAVKVALHRLRRRFGEMLRSEIAHTVADPAEVEDELRYLFAALGE